MTKMGFLRDFRGVIGRFLREFVAIAGFIIFFDYKVAEKSLGYLCTERDFWGIYRGILGDLRMQKPRAGVSVNHKWQFRYVTIIESIRYFPSGIRKRKDGRRSGSQTLRQSNMPI